MQISFAIFIISFLFFDGDMNKIHSHYMFACRFHLSFTIAKREKRQQCRTCSIKFTASQQQWVSNRISTYTNFWHVKFFIFAHQNRKSNEIWLPSAGFNLSIRRIIFLPLFYTNLQCVFFFQANELKRLRYVAMRDANQSNCFDVVWHKNSSVIILSHYQTIQPHIQSWI